MQVVVMSFGSLRHSIAQHSGVVEKDDDLGDHSSNQLDQLQRLIVRVIGSADVSRLVSAVVRQRSDVKVQTVSVALMQTSDDRQRKIAHGFSTQFNLHIAASELK